MTNAQVNPASVLELAPVVELLPVQTLTQQKPVKLWASLQDIFHAEWASLDVENAAIARKAKLHDETFCRAYCKATAEFLVSGNRHNSEKLASALGYSTKKEREALQELVTNDKPAVLKNATIEQAEKRLSALNASIRAIIAPVKEKATRKPSTDWKAAYITLHAHCKASGFSMPTGIPAP